MKKSIIVLTMGLLMLRLFGCTNSVKYNVDYCGQKDFYSGAKDSYEAGQTVHLKYWPIATDTNYYFNINVDSFSCQRNDNCVVIEFVMPEHDVVVECQFKNSMANTEN